MTLLPIWSAVKDLGFCAVIRGELEVRKAVMNYDEREERKDTAPLLSLLPLTSTLQEIPA